MSQLLKSSEGPLLRRRRHLESPKSYIAAKLLSLPTTFTLGDKKNYNGFYNKPLNTEQEYRSFVMAVLQNNETDSSANYVRLTCTHQPTYRLAFICKKIGICKNPPVYVNLKLNVTFTQAFQELLLLVLWSLNSLYNEFISQCYDIMFTLDSDIRDQPAGHHCSSFYDALAF